MSLNKSNLTINAEIEANVYTFHNGSKVPVTRAEKVIRSESGVIHAVYAKPAPELGNFLEQITDNFIAPSDKSDDFWLTYMHKKHKNISFILNQDGDIKLFIDQQEVLCCTNLGIKYNPKLLNEAILKINDVTIS